MIKAHLLYVEDDESLRFVTRDHLELEGIFNHSSSLFNLVPSEQQTTTGAINQAIRFSVYFDGNEKDRFRNTMGGLSLSYFTERLNLKLTPTLLEGDSGPRKLRDLIRTYFGLGGHHIQFNVVSGDTLRAAQARPDEHRDLIVRVAGYSDYFCDLSRPLQDEIISRTEHASL